MVSMMSDVDSRFESSILSFMELKNETMQNEIDQNTKKYDNYKQTIL